MDPLVGCVIGDNVVVDSIHQGENAEVLQARDINTGEYIVVKKLSKEDEVQREIDIHRQLDHPNILRIKNVVEDFNNIYIVTDRANTDLFDVILDQKLREEVIRCVFIQLLDALEYLHAKNIVHRDVKPENILLNNGTVMLTDFGFARHFVDENGEHVDMTTPCGSPPYVAPEVLVGSYSGPTVDVWSAGCTLFAMVTRTLPWDLPHEKCPEYRAVSQGDFSSHPWNTIPDHIFDVIVACLTVDPTHRPTISELKKMPWLKDLSHDGNL